MHLRKVLTGVGALTLVALALLFTRSLSTAAPTFTGDAAADFTGNDVIVLQDRGSDVGMPDVYSDTVVSGFDIQAIYLEYDPAADIMYVGVDCVVICGDADGDGDPDAAGDILGKPAAEGGLGGVDAPLLGEGEAFGLLIDTDNDYDSQAFTGDFDVVIGISENTDTSGIGAFTYIGEIGEQLVADTWDAPLPNAIALFAAPSAAAPDLEFTIADFSTLPGLPAVAGLPPIQLHFAIGSIVDDGIGEDYAPDQVNPIEITPTPTPTNTFVPTEPPTATPTNTFVPTEPATPTPTNTFVPTMPPPTATPTAPPPTEVPPTGSDLLARAALADDSSARFDAARQAEMRIIGQGDFTLHIPAIDLTTKVLARGWSTLRHPDGATEIVWDEISYAPGWHTNSALPGESGNVVMSGHNNIAGSVFRDLWELERGNTIDVSFNRVRYTYLVERVTVEPEAYATEAQRNANAAYIQQTTDNRLTLVTCWPWYGSSHRVFVVAKLKSMSLENLDLK